MMFGTRRGKTSLEKHSQVPGDRVQEGPFPTHVLTPVHFTSPPRELGIPEVWSHQCDSSALHWLGSAHSLWAGVSLWLALSLNYLDKSYNVPLSTEDREAQVIHTLILYPCVINRLSPLTSVSRMLVYQTQVQLLALPKS